jgi:hypothetical protein
MHLASHIRLRKAFNHNPLNPITDLPTVVLSTIIRMLVNTKATFLYISFFIKVTSSYLVLNYSNSKCDNSSLGQVWCFCRCCFSNSSPRIVKATDRVLESIRYFPKVIDSVGSHGLVVSMCFMFLKVRSVPGMVRTSQRPCWLCPRRSTGLCICPFLQRVPHYA